MTVIGDFTESDLIARIQARLAPAPPWLLVGIGDDAAVIEPERNRLEVLSVDTIVEGVHFDPAFVPAEAIGHRALAVNLSDLAAMGAAPRLALLAMALPSSLPVADFDGIVTGFRGLAGRHRLHVVGGNLTKSPGPLMIDVTVAGTVKRRQVLTRAGARPGDEVYVSGTIGSAAAGLRLLRADSRLTTGDSRLVTAYLRPEPRIRLGVWLGRNRAATACIDLSDGLADGVHRIAQASDVGITIEANALPIEDTARHVLEGRGGNAVEGALSGGDDYELLFTVGRRKRRSVAAASRHAGMPLTRVGVCTADRAVLLQQEGVPTPLPPTGYTHFANATTQDRRAAGGQD